MTTTAISLVTPAVMTALEGIAIASDGLTAQAWGKELEGKTPNDLSGRLGTYLYQHLHAGMPDQGKNRQRSLRDPKFDQRLADVMPHRTTVVSGSVVSTPDGADAIIEIDRIRVRIPRAQLAEPIADPSVDEVALRVPAPRPALSPGFFLADGSLGRAVGAGPKTLRVYVHVVDPDAAVAAWGTVLTHLEGLGVRYRAKVTSGARLFPRRDGLVVYLGPDAWDAAAEVATCVQELSGLGRTTSPFTHRLATGVSVAWEPDDLRPGKRSLSFGEHRCQAVAEALVSHAVRTDSGSPDSAVAEAFLNAGVDPLMPARNLSSPVLPAIGLM
ncbi:T3SS effector HopA1 family protein [Streptomyces alfalfae]